MLGMNDAWKQEAASIFGCSQIVLPLGVSMRKVSAWNPILQKIQRKLMTWKAKTLPRAGRLVLIKSVLNSLPLYYLSLFKMSKAVTYRIIQIQRRFLWVGDKAGAFSALVKWEVVQLPKSRGRLGVGDILMKNARPLFKWWWRFS